MQVFTSFYMRSCDPTDHNSTSVINLTPGPALRWPCDSLGFARLLRGPGPLHSSAGFDVPALSVPRCLSLLAVSATPSNVSSILYRYISYSVRPTRKQNTKHITE